MLVSFLVKNWRLVAVGVGLILLSIYIINLKDTISSLKDNLNVCKVTLNEANNDIDRLVLVDNENKTTLINIEKSYKKLINKYKRDINITKNSNDRLLRLIDSLKHKKNKVVIKEVYKLKKCEVTIVSDGDVIIDELNKALGE